MDTVRYYVALVIVAGFPPPLLAWLLIHPLADTLRRIGIVPAYLLIYAFYAAGMFSIWLVRDTILCIDFGYSLPLSVLAVVLFFLSIYIRVQWRRVLRPSTILGLPEIKGLHEPGDLVTRGIYSRVRHPRYLEVGLGLWAFALFSNYLAGYMVGLAYIPVILLVVELEEQELRNRFGTLYDDYCAGVPRFIPRMRLRGLHRGRG
jgi:protein-S-isoprenylcysteine O-methyltransferase Ste14